MQDYQRDFLEYAMRCEVLRFGEFTLKSGRVSPYFFNAGLFNTGARIAALGRYYARAARDSDVRFDMVFGPAYKGVPLAVAAVIALAEHHGLDLPYAFNRKEAKDHGEGGNIVGAPLAGRVLIVDDVISAGTSVNESVELIKAAGATPAGVIIALDRQERGTGTRSAIAEVEERHRMPVVSIVKMEHVMRYLELRPGQTEVLERMRGYRAQYGV